MVGSASQASAKYYARLRHPRSYDNRSTSLCGLNGQAGECCVICPGDCSFVVLTCEGIAMRFFSLFRKPEPEIEPLTRPEMVKVRELAHDLDISIMDAVTRFREEQARRNQILDELIAELEASSNKCCI